MAEALGPEAEIGAGTVLTVEDVARVQAAGGTPDRLAQLRPRGDPRHRGRGHGKLARGDDPDRMLRGAQGRGERAEDLPRVA